MNNNSSLPSANHITALFNNNDINIILDLINKYGFDKIKDENGNNTLHLVAVSGNINLIDYFIKSKVDVNSINSYKITPLHFACLSDNPEIVQFLISHNANINAQNIDGDTPLHDACEKNYIEVIQLFLSNNINIDLKNRKNETALDIAIKYNHTDIIQIFERYKNYHELTHNLNILNNNESIKKPKL